MGADAERRGQRVLGLRLRPGEGGGVSQGQGGGCGRTWEGSGGQSAPRPGPRKGLWVFLCVTEGPGRDLSKE